MGGHEWSMGKAAAIAAVVGALVSGCTGSTWQGPGFAEGAGVTAADGSWTVVAPEERGDPVDLQGETVDGEQVDVEDWRGAPVVINTWYAACGPCRAEAPDLAAVSSDVADEGVHFLGINVRDGAAQALAFERQFGIDYPSLLGEDGKAVLSLRGDIPPAGTPATLVLDADGRVSGRITGPADPSILRSMITDVA